MSYDVQVDDGLGCKYTSYFLPCDFGIFYRDANGLGVQMISSLHNLNASHNV